MLTTPDSSHEPALSEPATGARFDGPAGGEARSLPGGGLVVENAVGRVEEKRLGLLSDREVTWLRNQQRKAMGQRSKYVPHQGVRERARRLRRG